MLVYCCLLLAPKCLPSLLCSRVSAPVIPVSIRPSTELSVEALQYRPLLFTKADCIRTTLQARAYDWSPGTSA